MKEAYKIFLISNTIMVEYKFTDEFQYILYKKNLAILGGLIAIFLLNIQTNYTRYK